MDLIDYQKKIRLFDQYHEPTRFQALIMGLCSESGEVAGKVKKVMRGDGKLEKAALISEFGDVLWYLTRLADMLNVNIPEIAKLNYEKLSSRYERNTIKGDGDDR